MGSKKVSGWGTKTDFIALLDQIFDRFFLDAADILEHLVSNGAVTEEQIKEAASQIAAEERKKG